MKCLLLQTSVRIRNKKSESWKIGRDQSDINLGKVFTNSMFWFVPFPYFIKSVFKKITAALSKTTYVQTLYKRNITNISCNKDAQTTRR